MVSRTAKQARFMAACAHNPEPMKGKCPPPKVAKEFNQADKKAGTLKGKGKP